MVAIQDAYRCTVENYNKDKIGLGKSDEKWMKDVIRSGTISDKIAALALKVQESPFHNLDALEMLTAIVSKNEQRTVQLALDAIKDLLLNNLLPNRKLVPLNCRIAMLMDPEITLAMKDSTIMKVALLMYFEDVLKKAVEVVVSAVDSGMKSMVEFFKRSCMTVAVDMLKSKPEQEGRLLTLLVSRLGDHASVVSSKCMELLKGLLHTHPAMKLVVIKEVRQLIYKSQTKLRTIFTSVVFLSSITLVSWDNEAAVQLVDCYLSLFESALQGRKF
jgi:ribosome biogenesis protein MAK21